MKNIILIAVCFLFSLSAFAQDRTHDLMPVPQSLKTTGDRCRILKSFTIGVIGNPGERVYKEASRSLRNLDNRAGLFFSQGFITAKDNNPSANLLIEVKRPANLKLYEDESYQLTINNNQAKITANTDLGAIWGLQTLYQLLSVDEKGYYFPGVEINDAPRFPWRGLMIDITLHWMPMDVIERTLDCMASVKMNVLHLHLTEDQMFGIESKVFPKLHELGSDGNYYTQEDIKRIIAYADQRGIRIVPEFDIPGHCTSWLIGYPELAAKKRNYELQRYFGVFDPALDVTKDYTYEFLDKLFTEMCQLFPDEYFHIGGDENTGKDWASNPDIKAYMDKKGMKTYRELETEFMQRLLPIVTKNGKKMMGWDEIFRPGVPHDIMIESWRGEKTVVESARQGYPSILSAGYYIDLIQPTDYHYLVDPIPANTVLTPEQQKFIAGGEATMWTEHTSIETVDSRIWPRTAAIAERFWSAQSVRDVDDMYRRLDQISLLLEGLGSTHMRNKQVLLRRLANSYDTKALEVLVDVIEPLKIYQRNEKGKMYNVFSPYTKIADVATPDQQVAREFRKNVSAYCKTPNAGLEKNITDHLKLWKANHPAFLEAVKRSPELGEAVILSENLAKISEVGLQAISYLKTHRTPSADWKVKSLEITKNAKQQGGRCDLQVVTAIEELVNTVKK